MYKFKKQGNNDVWGKKINNTRVGKRESLHLFYFSKASYNSQ